MENAREKGGGRKGKEEIPGTVGDAIEIKRKCESTCRHDSAFIRVLLRDSCMVLPRELHPCEIEFQSLVTADTRRSQLLFTTGREEGGGPATRHLIVRDGIRERENSRFAPRAINGMPSVILCSLNLHTDHSVGRISSRSRISSTRPMSNFLRRKYDRETVVRPACRSL